MFYITIEHKSSCNIFFLTYCKNITNFLFWVLWTCLAVSFKKDNANLQKLMFICMQKVNFIFNFFFWDIKNIANLLFCELWGCLTIPIKIIVSICCTFLWLSACKKSTLSFISFSRYCKEMANLLFWVIWACLAIQI